MVMAMGAHLHIKCRNPGRETVFPFGVALHVQLSAQLSDLLAINMKVKWDYYGHHVQVKLIT